MTARIRQSGIATLGFLVVLLASCTTVQTEYEAGGGQLPRPEVIVVYDFAVAADEVKLDSSLMGSMGSRMDETPLSDREIQTGRRVADALASKLVAEIQSMGLQAVRAAGRPRESRRVVMIEGQFLSINQGRRGERVVIGLGAGRTSVRLRTELYGRTREGRRMLAAYEVDAKGSRKPGMAETMGFGAAAGNLAISAAASGAGAVGSEALSETVEADAKRGARSLARKLGEYFAQQNWISEEEIPEEFAP